MTGKSESELINDYFARVHAYRVAADAYPHRGVVWADDDWSGYSASVMNELYSETLTINDKSEHTRIARSIAPLSNRINTGNLPGETIRTQMLILPRLRDDHAFPALAPDAQCAFLFDSNGQAVAYLRPAPGGDPRWHTLSNAVPIMTNQWIKLTLTNAYDTPTRYFSLAIDDAAPITDPSVGHTRAKDTNRCRFVMADQSRDYMSAIDFTGAHHLDDLTVNLSTTNALLLWLVAQ